MKDHCVCVVFCKAHEQRESVMEWLKDSICCLRAEKSLTFLPVESNPNRVRKSPSEEQLCPGPHCKCHRCWLCVCSQPGLGFLRPAACQGHWIDLWLYSLWKPVRSRLREGSTSLTAPSVLPLGWEPLRSLAAQGHSWTKEHTSRSRDKDREVPLSRLRATHLSSPAWPFR